MFKIGDRIRIKVPSEAADVFPDMVGQVFTIESIGKPVYADAGRWILLTESWISGLHERDVVMAHGPCAMEARK